MCPQQEVVCAPEGGDGIKAGCMEQHMAHSGSPFHWHFLHKQVFLVSIFLKTGILSQTPLAQIDEDPPERLGNGPGAASKVP